MSADVMALATCESCKHRHCCSSQDIDACREGGAILTWEPWTNDDIDRIGRYVGNLERGYIRLRISQLRRMAQLCGDLEARSLLYAANCQGMNWRRYHDRKRPIIDRADRFRAACLAEIERLRGMG